MLKHAQARTVEVVIEIQPPWLLLRVRDDGIGLALNRLRALGCTVSRRCVAVAGGSAVSWSFVVRPREAPRSMFVYPWNACSRKA